jgi:signal transduction histidine kinase
MTTIPMPGLDMSKWGRLKLQLEDAVPLVLFTVFFLGNAILGYVSIRNVAEIQLEADNARANIGMIHELLVDVLRAETAQRGYLLTGLDNYATPYFDALSSIDHKMINLAAARLDHEQRNRFYELQVHIDERVAELQRNYELIRSEGMEAAVQSIMSHRGMRQMADIDTLTLAMAESERTMLARSLENAENRRVTSFVLMLTANLVGLGLVLLSLMAVRKARRKEQQYLDELMDAKEGLEQKVLERTSALQHFSNELKRSNRELQDFAFVASHDLQEPLRKIRAFGDRLQQSYGEKLGEQGADYVRRMQMASERMSRLITDLLSFSRITTKAKPFEPVALNRIAEEVIDDLEVAIDEARASISCGDLPEIEADVFQIKQLFQNLIGNAIKFHKPGVPPIITITADPPSRSRRSGEQECITLRFSDNGIGFDEVFLDRIFLPFQRLHGRGEYSGTGIGLAICRRVAERHGGSLTAISKPDIGSTFIVRLARTNQVYAFEDKA